MIEKIVSSIPDLIKELVTDNEGYGGEIWYRGHYDQSWLLIPGLYRLLNPVEETTLLKKFSQNARLLVSAYPQNTFEWMFLMQHHGVPTRLLDWTESPLVALYFAVADVANFIGSDGAIWSLKPSELNKHANIIPEDAFFIPSFDDEELKSYSIEKLSTDRRTKNLPLATIASRNNPRIQAQLGAFTIHHRDQVPIEQISKGDHVIKYIIPKETKQIILKQLALLGFSKFQLFPELASIGDTIKLGLA